MIEKYKKYLPIGSVVMLKEGKKRIMITGFTVMKDGENQIVYDYTGCLYPEGFMGADKMLLFNHEDISRIYCIGYSDDEEKGFKEILNNMDFKTEE